MKKGLLIGLFAGALAIVAIFLLIVVYSPKTLLEDVLSSDVKTIKVLNGTNEEQFEITNSDDIEFIVKNIQDAQIKWGGFAVGENKKYVYEVSFYDKEGKEIGEKVTIASGTRFLDGYYYYDAEEENCLEYIEELEEKHELLKQLQLQ